MGKCVTVESDAVKQAQNEQGSFSGCFEYIQRIFQAFEIQKVTLLASKFVMTNCKSGGKRNSLC